MRKFLPLILLVIVGEGAGGRKKVFIWRFRVHNSILFIWHFLFRNS